MKEKRSYYLAMMAGILLFTVLVPVMIRAASGAFIRRFAPGTAEIVTEAEDDRYRVLEGFTEAGNDVGTGGSGAAGSGAEINADGDYEAQHEHDPDLVKKELQQMKEQTDEELASYLGRQEPVFTESRAGMLEAFAGGREENLAKAVADHLYGTYGVLYDISVIDVVDFVDDTSTELTCQIRVTAKIGSREYGEYYFATYNKVYDFYSIYAYHE